MVEGGWPFIWTAYALTTGGLLLLAVFVVLRLRHWAKKAKELDRA